MVEATHGTLRKKLGGARVGRPPVSDIVELGEQFARLLEDRLRVALRYRPDAKLIEAKGQKFGDALATTDDSSLFTAVSIDDGFGGMAAITPALAARLIEMVTGVTSPANPGTASEAPPRSLTAIDKALLQEPASAIFGAFGDAAASTLPDDVSNAFADPFFVVQQNDDDGRTDLDGLSLSITLTLTSPEDAHQINLFIPLTTLDKLDPQTTPAQESVTAAPSVWSRTMLQAARGASFRMVGVLHEKQMSIGDIKDMKVGGVIPLPPDHKMRIGLRMDTPEGVAQEPTIGGGVLGAIDGQRAVRLSAPPDEEFLGLLKIIA